MILLLFKTFELVHIQVFVFVFLRFSWVLPPPQPGKQQLAAAAEAVTALASWLTATRKQVDLFSQFPMAETTRQDPGWVPVQRLGICCLIPESPPS